ncbi:hypothetical protein K370107A2_12980 [Merdimmobilis hominis]
METAPKKLPARRRAKPQEPTGANLLARRRKAAKGGKPPRKKGDSTFGLPKIEGAAGQKSGESAGEGKGRP